MRIEIDETKFAELGLKFEVAGNQAKFTLPDTPGTIPVSIEGGAIMLFPDRAAAHRRLIAALKLTP